MLTIEQAHRRAEAFLADEISGPECELAILEDATVEFARGWVFFYDSVVYLRTGDEMSRAVGNAPLLVDKRSGEVHVTGTGRPIEYYIAQFERHGTCHPETG